MKTTLAIIGSVLLAATAAAADLSSSEAKRLDEAAAAVRELRGAADNGIPEALWNRAECVAVIPGLKKAAFMIGGEFGKGVISCRAGQNWSAPVFIELEKGSAGLQIGAESVDVVLLVMNRAGVEKMLSDKVNLGGDVSVAAGPVGRTASASTDAKLSAEILAYSRAKGAFAGINLSGGVLKAEKDANRNAYGETPVNAVLFKSAAPAPAAASAFLRTLREESRATTGRK